MRLLKVVAVLGGILPVLAVKLPLHSSSRWILDGDNNRVKLRCINWAGHMEANLPEGLHKQSIDYIADIIKQQGFNCVRLTYSIDMALSPDTKVSDAFTAAAGAASVSVESMNGLYTQALTHNPDLANLSTREVFGAVIAALWEREIMTILDNHVSKASWCCNLEDGNGWWNSAFGYNTWNSRFFDTDKWLDGLQSMAVWAQSQPGVIGLSLRNEIREFLLQGWNSRNDWYDLISRAAKLVHGSNPDVLILIGGTQSATDMTHVRTRPLDISEWRDKNVWEWHAYSFTVTFQIGSGNCDVIKEEYGAFAGFLLEQGKDYTGPLMLSEFGVGLSGGPNQGLSDKDKSYLDCIKSYMTGNDADWAVWAIQGSYYVRDQGVDKEETWGLLDYDWKGLRNLDFMGMIGDMLKVTQGP